MCCAMCITHDIRHTIPDASATTILYGVYHTDKVFGGKRGDVIRFFKKTHLEVKVDQLSLLRRPLPVGIPVVNNLITSRIPKLGSCVAQNTIGRPFDFVAGRFGDQEWFGATDVLVVVDAFLNFEIHD